MMINNLISRISKIIFGVFLIGITLTTEVPVIGNAALLSLIAVPFVIGGLFNWTPLVWTVQKVTEYMKPLAAYSKFPVKSA